MTTAGTLADRLLLRIRDPLGTAHTRDVVLRVLTECQRLVNAETRAVLGTATLDVDAGNKILDVTTLLPFAIRVETIRDGLRDLTKVSSWRAIAQADRAWLKRPAGIVEMWAPVGPMRLILYPAAAQPTTLTLVTCMLTNALTLDADVLQLPDPLLPAVLNLAEQVLLCRQRLFPSAKAAADRLPDAIGATSR